MADEVEVGACPPDEVIASEREARRRFQRTLIRHRRWMMVIVAFDFVMAIWNGANAVSGIVNVQPMALLSVVAAVIMVYLLQRAIVLYDDAAFDLRILIEVGDDLEKRYRAHGK